MSETPWLTIIGQGEDGLKGLAAASRDALETAEIIIGPPRHLSLIGPMSAETREWPVPFADGIAPLLALRGRPVVVLASGDPFWFGAGAVLARHLNADEWHCLPGPSTFSLAASRLGWALETTVCLGLHAAPMSRLRPHLAPGVRMIVLLRDGSALRDLAMYLAGAGFATSMLTVLEALGGPREKRTQMQADTLPEGTFAHPVCVSIDLRGAGTVLPLSAGRSEKWFDNDGQITRQPVRAMTLAALAPHPFEHLWDIGGGSGSVAIEWLLCHPTLSATTFEPRPDRAARIRANADRLGVDRLRIVTGAAPQALHDQPPPQAVFVGGGLDADLIEWLQMHLSAGTRLVANSVTLETETLLMQAQLKLGGTLTRLVLSRAEPLGPRRGWKTSYPIVQWSIRL